MCQHILNLPPKVPGFFLVGVVLKRSQRYIFASYESCGGTYLMSNKTGYLLHFVVQVHIGMDVTPDLSLHQVYL